MSQLSFVVILKVYTLVLLTSSVEKHGHIFNYQASRLLLKIWNQESSEHKYRHALAAGYFRAFWGAKCLHLHTIYSNVSNVLETNKSKSHFRCVTLMLCWLIVSCVRFLIKLPEQRPKRSEQEGRGIGDPLCVLSSW